MIAQKIAQWGCTGVLVVLNTLVYLSLLLLPVGTREFLEQWFALSREGVLHGAIWQLLTYQFLHATFLHLLVNMLALWFVGELMQRELGLRRFLILYLAGGAVGGALQLVFQGNETVVVGASAAVCSVLIGFCTLHPQQRITALIFFIIPLQLKAKTLGWGITIVSLILALVGWPPGIGNLAHFGGCVFGFLATRFWMRRSWYWSP
jgi:membrane associated rhomboid family serine protease